MLYSLGLAYGSRGAFYFPYTTLVEGDIAMPGLVASEPQVDRRDRKRRAMDHRSNQGMLFGQQRWTGYAEKWTEVTSVNSRLRRLETTVAGLAWHGARSWNSGRTAGTWAGLVTQIVTRPGGTAAPEGKPFVETSHFTDSRQRDYLMVVNRLCGKDDAQTVTLTLNAGRSRETRVENLQTGQKWTLKDQRVFSDRIMPGDVAVYRVQRAP